jgi:effector-binding domain-containing protein
MIDPPQIIQTDARRTAIIRLTVPRVEIEKVMQHNIGELMAAVAAQGVEVAGPLFTHHLRMDPQIFDFELGLPVKTAVAADGRIQPSEWPAMKVAQTIYHGPYEGLAAAWGEFHAWIAANGHKPATDLWECYLREPESDSVDPSTWRTELNRPLLD